MLCFVLVNESTSASALAAQLTTAWLARCAAAVTKQLQTDVAGVYPEAQGAVVRVGSGPTDIGAGEIAFAILDSLPDAPGAIAYHDVNGQAVPVAFLALTTCSTLDDVSTAISHECVETVGDAACNVWVDDGQGHEWARELCDAVESNAYGVDLGDGQPSVKVSDFLLPSFFASGAPGPFNFMANVLASAVPGGPFKTAAGGYQIQRQSGGGETQVTGEIRRMRVAKVQHWSSRVYRRGARV